MTDEWPEGEDAGPPQLARGQRPTAPSTRSRRGSGCPLRHAGVLLAEAAPSSGELTSRGSMADVAALPGLGDAAARRRQRLRRESSRMFGEAGCRRGTGSARILAMRTKARQRRWSAAPSRRPGGRCGSWAVVMPSLSEAPMARRVGRFPRPDRCDARREPGRSRAVVPNRIPPDRWCTARPPLYSAPWPPRAGNRARWRPRLSSAVMSSWPPWRSSSRKRVRADPLRRSSAGRAVAARRTCSTLWPLAPRRAGGGACACKVSSPRLSCRERGS